MYALFSCIALQGRDATERLPDVVYSLCTAELKIWRHIQKRAAAMSPSKKRDQVAAHSNRRASPVSVPVTSQWCAQEAADLAARIHDGLLLANMVEDHHEGVHSMLLAAVSSHAPGVMT